MSILVEVSDVMTRLRDLPGVTLPKQVDATRVGELVRSASGTLMTRMGYTTPPATGSNQRLALDDVCVRLVVNMVLADIYQGRTEMREQLRRERRDLLSEADELSLVGASDSGAFFHLTGGG